MVDSETESSSSSSDEDPMSSMAASREKRVTAGNRMARLLEAEDEDDFYKTTYGGFEEEEDDRDYQSEASKTDVTDSDFDINEEDELKSDVENEKEVKEKKKSVYQDPKKLKTDPAIVNKETKPKPENTEKNDKFVPTEIVWEKSVRKSTAEKSRCIDGLLKERELKAAQAKMNHGERKKAPEMRRLTQEELLEEAKITEEINLASLETYQKMELERKRVRSQKQSERGPMIRYHSISTPLQPPPYFGGEDGGVVLEFGGNAKHLPPSEKCSRNFISFTDKQTFISNFPSRNPPKAPLKPQLCVVTGLRAKYREPLTSLPCATLEAFKIIREAYQQKLQEETTD